jgi:hypothetical protein
MRAGRAVGNVLAGFPARDGAAVNAELTGQHGVAGAALLDGGAGARRGGGVGVQSQMHQLHSPGSACGSGVVASGRRSPRWVHRDLPRAAPPDSRGVASRARGFLLWTYMRIRVSTRFLFVCIPLFDRDTPPSSRPRPNEQRAAEVKAGQRPAPEVPRS